MLKVVALRVAARLVLDWTVWTAIALAVVLANSGVEHIRPDAALLRHYQDAAGMPALAYAIGVVQLAAAAAMIWRRTRYGACAALIAMLIISMGNQIIGGRAGDGLAAPLLVLLVAAAVARAERRRINAQPPGIRT
jgi:hypothetical protein